MILRELHRNVKIRLFEQFLSSMVGNMIAPFLIVYFAAHWGAPVAGAIFIINTLISIVAGLYGGHLADQYGRRTVMLRSEIIRFIATVVMMLAATPWMESPVLILIAMTIRQIMSTIARPAGDAMILDVCTPENRKTIFSLDYWMFNIAVLIGGLVGGFFFKDYMVILLAVVALMSLTSLLLLVFWIQDTYVKKQEAPSENQPHRPFRRIMGHYRIVLKDFIFLLFLGATLLQLSIQYGTNNYAVVRLANEMTHQLFFSWGDFRYVVDGYQMFGIINAVNTFLVVTLGVLIGKWVKKLNDKTAIYGGMVLYSAGYAFIAGSSQPWMLILAVSVMTIGELIFIPSKQSVLANLVPSENRGAYMAVNGLTNKGASIVGSAAVSVGAFVSSWSMAAAFSIMGILCIFVFSVIFSRLKASGKTEESSTSIHA
ncbi:hypothetical protein CIG75_02600 [Tumebacillus algifaecis]|uniref:Major facilitator superfamily (MFS) profile domain-containing protein n=1 Tax=Tumebacillus algifaecis TaxID=1214604 RepID=A0A223CX75_9BACL|nr:MFS transporter [Tumebacillus algifaecis]ASS73979.1 hypothetical protein CIG75_02600 [Tumebacillus algifaecis]